MPSDSLYTCCDCMVMSSSSCVFYSQDAHRRELHIRLCSAEISLRIEQYASVPCNIDLIARLGPPVNFSANVTSRTRRSRRNPKTLPDSTHCIASLSEREQGKELLVEMVVSDADDKSDGYNRRFHPDSDDAGSSKCELPCSEEERFVLQARTRKMGLSQMILFTS